MARSTSFDPANVSEALAVQAELERLLEELDRLELHEPGAHLSLAIHVLERRILQTGRVSPWPEHDASRPS
jgi:hypothetical protein